MATLTEEQIKEEDKFLAGLPRFNLAAFLIPPIWGFANGFWVTILYYPAWIFMDNLLYAAVSDPTVLSCVFAGTTIAAYIGISIAFSLVSQPMAAHRAQDMGVSRETYLKRQRIWAIASVVIAVVLLSLATWYNLDFRQ